MRIEEKLSSRLENIPEFINKILKSLKNLKIGEEDMFNIKLSLEESLVNAVKYGNKLNPELFVEFFLEAESDDVTIRVKDQGQGFDYKNVLDPTKQENLARTSGRGIFLIKSLMDKVEYSQGGRQLTMVKFLKKNLKTKS